MIVSLNGETVTGGNYTAAFAGAKPRGNSSSIATTVSDDSLPIWAKALMTSLGCFVLVICLLYVCRRIQMARGNKGRRHLAAPKQKLTTDTDDYADDDDDVVEASPMNSDIISVASSNFTYNPAHLYGTKTASIAVKTDATSGSNQSLLLFHNDISAISNKKDLSLIYEEQNEDASTAASEQTTPQGNAARRRFVDSAAQASLLNTTSLDLNGPAQTVIEDLNNLSAQIDTYRRASKGGVGGDFA